MKLKKIVKFLYKAFELFEMVIMLTVIIVYTSIKKFKGIPFVVVILLCALFSKVSETAILHSCVTFGLFEPKISEDLIMKYDN